MNEMKSLKNFYNIDNSEVEARYDIWADEDYSEETKLYDSLIEPFFT